MNDYLIAALGGSAGGFAYQAMSSGDYMLAFDRSFSICLGVFLVWLVKEKIK